MNREFQVHVLNGQGKSNAEKIAEAFDDLLVRLTMIVPEPSREMSLCRTKLEEACFFAKKAMASKPENVQA